MALTSSAGMCEAHELSLTPESQGLPSKLLLPTRQAGHGLS